MYDVLLVFIREVHYRFWRISMIEIKLSNSHQMKTWQSFDCVNVPEMCSSDHHLLLGNSLVIWSEHYKQLHDSTKLLHRAMN